MRNVLTITSVIELAVFWTYMAFATTPTFAYHQRPRVIHHYHHAAPPDIHIHHYDQEPRQYYAPEPRQYYDHGDSSGIHFHFPLGERQHDEDE